MMWIVTAEVIGTITKDFSEFKSDLEAREHFEAEKMFYSSHYKEGTYKIMIAEVFDIFE